MAGEGRPGDGTYSSYSDSTALSAGVLAVVSRYLAMGRTVTESRGKKVSMDEQKSVSRNGRKKKRK